MEADRHNLLLDEERALYWLEACIADIVEALQKTATFLGMLLKNEIPTIAPVEYFDDSAENMTSFPSFLKQHDSQFCGYWMFPSTLFSFNKAKNPFSLID